MAFLTLLRKRLLGLLLVVFGVSLITFAISHLILAVLALVLAFPCGLLLVVAASRISVSTCGLL